MSSNLYLTVRAILKESAQAMMPLSETLTYGGWLSPSGVETPVINAQYHEPVAQKILGADWRTLVAAAGVIEASELLGMRGWARLVHYRPHTYVDIDKNVRLTGRQLSYLKNLGIEQNIDIILDTGTSERYLFKAGE